MNDSEAVQSVIEGLSSDDRESLSLLTALGAAVLMDAAQDGEHGETAMDDLAIALPLLRVLCPTEANEAATLLDQLGPLSQALAASLPAGLTTVTPEAVQHCQALLLGHGLVLDDEQVRDGIAYWLLGHGFLTQVAAVDSAVVGEPWARAVLQDELGTDLVALPFTDRYSAAADAVRGDASG